MILKASLIIGLSFLGAIGGHTCWHLYNDHETFHGLINSIVQQQQQQRQQVAPK